MTTKKIQDLIELNRKLIDETCQVKKELIRIRSKLETQVYKTATKYNVVNNDLLVVKNKYRGLTKSYKSIADDKTTDRLGYVSWD
jgi:hypothetical protein